MIQLPDWLPRSILTVRQGYTTRDLSADLIAGATVGLVALPLAMAFAISSGLTPQAGIYCAIITGFLISALGGSRFQIGGPTGAFVVVVSGIVGEYGIDGLFTCTLMAGVILVIMGLTGTGTAVKYIPRPVIVGFTNGIALVITSTQVRDFLGLTVPVPGEFIERAGVLAEHALTASLPSVALGTASLMVLIFWNRAIKRVPGYIVALVFGTVAVAVLRSRGRHDRIAVRRHSGVAARVPRAAIQPGSCADADFTGGHGGHARRDRIAACRPWLPIAWAAIVTIPTPSCSRRAWPTSCRRCLAGCRPPARSRAPPRTSAAGARTPIAGMVHAITLLGILMFGASLAASCAVAGAGRHPVRRGLEHGRVVGDRRGLQAHLYGCHWCGW